MQSQHRSIYRMLAESINCKKRKINKDHLSKEIISLYAVAIDICNINIHRHWIYTDIDICKINTEWLLTVNWLYPKDLNLAIYS